jgi:hypothetical protein
VHHALFLGEHWYERHKTAVRHAPVAAGGEAVHHVADDRGGYAPPAPVGRFAGTLEPETLERLRAAIADAERAGDLTEEMPAGSAIEETAVGKRTATLPHTASPTGRGVRCSGSQACKG